MGDELERSAFSRADLPRPRSDLEEEVDVVVIGSGIGGLSCGALLAKYGYEVLVLESHSLPGGCCHMFKHRSKSGGEYEFEVGPSIWEGLERSSFGGNPLRQVLDALGEHVEVENYDGWGMHTEEGSWRYTFGPDDAPDGGFKDVLRRHASDPEAAVREWEALVERLALLSEANDACPLKYLRQDPGLLATTAVALPFYLTHPAAMADVPLLFDSFSRVTRGIIKEPFLKNWIDCLSFFSGFPAEGTMGAAMIYCLANFHKPGAVLNAPVGGTGAVVGTLSGALERHGGSMRLRSHVEEIEVDPDTGRAAGVRLKGGARVRARTAVVSNATVWDTAKLLDPSGLPPRAQGWREDCLEIPAHGSIMHLFLGVRGGDGLIEGLDPAHLVVNDWSKPLSDPQNVITIFIPSILDPKVAPEGHHVIHCYTAGSEPYDLWADKDRGSAEYKAFKEKRSQVLWEALERIIPDIRERVDVDILGSPLTHERFLRRYRGTYGPALAAGRERYLPQVAKMPFPGVKTPIPGLLRCGDSCFPGIGVPAAAASGYLAANSLVSVPQQLGLIAEGDRYRRAQQAIAKDEEGASQPDGGTGQAPPEPLAGAGSVAAATLRGNRRKP
eukprot:PRCOL_00004227-RA